MEQTGVIHLLRNLNTSDSSSDSFRQYLNSRSPSIVTNNKGDEIIIPPLNTDIRFTKKRKRSSDDIDAHKLAYSKHYR